MRPTPRLLLSLLACTPLICVSFAQDRPKPTPEQALAIEAQRKQTEIHLARRSEILDEIADIQAGQIEPGADWAREWAGEYTCKFGLGAYMIAIAPRGGISYSLVTSQLTLLEHNQGRIVEAASDSILVKLEVPVRPEGLDIISERLYFVRWGELKLLLSPPQLVALIDSIREQTRPTMINLLIAEASPQLSLFRQPPLEPPQIPELFAPLLKSPAIKATITHVELKDLGDSALNGVREDYYEVRFDKGRLDRVDPHSTIIAPSLRGGIGKMTVADHATTAGVIVRTTGPDYRVLSPPQVGDTWYIIVPSAAPQPAP